MQLTTLRTTLSSAIPSIVLLLVLVMSVGCDNPSDPDKDKDPTDSTKNPGDTAAFRITSVMGDSLYGHEIAELTAVGMGTDISKLRLFIHTHETTLLDLDGERLTFEIPTNARTGKLRLYRDDTLQAAGDFSMTLFGGNIKEINPTIVRCSPGDAAYLDEEIVLRGTDLPMRKRDLDIRIGQLPLHIISQDSTTIKMRLPAGAQTGTMSFTMFGKSLPAIEPFSVLEHGGAFLPSKSLTQVGLDIRSLNCVLDLRFNNGLDSTASITPVGLIDLNREFGSYETQARRVRDSLIIETNALTGTKRVIATIRLKLEQDSNFVSGTIECMIDQFEGTSKEMIEHFTVEIKGMRWKSMMGSYSIYSLESQMEDQLLDLMYYQGPRTDIQSRIFRYARIPKPEGSIVITMKP